MATISWQLKPSWSGKYQGGVITVDESRSYNVGAKLLAGGGALTGDNITGGTITEDAGDTALVRLLDGYEPLQRSGSTETPPAVAKSTRSVRALMTDAAPSVEQLVVRKVDGTFEERPLSVVGSTSSAVQVPVAGWNSNFRAKLAASASQLVRVGVFGDSLTQRGGWASEDAKSWVGLLAAALQTQYGDGGSGLKSMADSAAWLVQQASMGVAIPAWIAKGNLVGLTANGTGGTTSGVNTIANVTQTWVTGSPISGVGIPVGATVTAGATAGNTITISANATVTGTPNLYRWNEYTGGDNGPPGATVMKTNVVGETASFTVRGTTSTIYTIPNGGGNSAWRWRVDGGAWTDVADAGAFGIRTTTAALGAAGTHTLDVQCNGDGTKYLYLGGVEAHNTTGVVVHKAGRWGAKVANFAEGGATIKADQWNGGRSFPVDLAIIALGVNDSASTTTFDVYAQTLQQIVREIRSGTGQDGSTDILVVAMHGGTYADGGASGVRWSDFVTRMAQVARNSQAGFLNLWADGRASWNAWNSLAYWGNSGSMGAQGTDTVHLSDAGNQHIATLAQSLILAPAA